MTLDDSCAKMNYNKMTANHCQNFYSLKLTTENNPRLR